MDQRNHASLLGMAVMRGLISPEALGRVALASQDTGVELLEAVVAQGLLGTEDLRDLSSLMAAHGLTDPGEPKDAPTRLEPFREEATTGDGEASQPSPEGPARPFLEALAGRQVLDVLRMSAWKQYRNLEFLGEGGMGRIFKATDPVLKREVALKFLGRDDPERVLRFVLEAQHQALVDHPNICKVYEVGEWKGQSYIAMQLIRGRTLTQAREELTLREKVGVMQVVAEAIQAAHRQGLIHRDLKPGNIMVTREGDQLKPYLLDFGLSRGQESSGLTQVGVAVGTPGYMAPEQAKGVEGGVGFAADVYAMGATLYMLLAGDPPFVDTTGLELMRRTVEEDAPPMRGLLPDLPRELDTIVLKCLEKEPAARYPSALALAEDLRRYLAGEPLLAAPPPWWGVVWKKIRRNRNMSLVVGAATVALLALGTLALRAEWRAHRRAALAQRFGTESERLVGEYRWAQMLPLHDMRPQKAALRGWMVRLQRQMADLGSVAEGPGNFALGRACLALGDANQALKYLEAAWKVGNRDAETAELLGLAHGAVLQQGLEEANRLRTRSLKEARLAELKRLHGQPALAFLRLSGSNPSLVQEGRMALLEEHFDEALTKARLALERDPWLVEANLLMAQTHFARERKQSEQGDYEAAAHSTAEGLAAALQAESMARSSLEAYALEGEARFLELDLATEHGLPINQPAEAVRAALGKALLVDPEAGPVHVKMAITYRWWAEADEERGNDPQAHLEAALDHCRQAVRFCPDPYSATNLTTLTYQLLAEHLATHGRDPLPTLDLALASGKSAIEMRPQDHFPRNALGLVFLTKGTYLQKHGQDPHGDLRSALEMFADACRMSPGSWQSWGNQGICHRRLATQEAAEGANPLPSLDQARACYLEALKANPRESATLLNLGLLGRFRAGMELARGLDARTSLAEADQSLQRALEIKPGNASVLVGLGDLGALRGLQARLAGGNPLPDFQEAFRQYQKALASNRADPEAFERLANAWLEEGRYLAGEGRSAGAALAQAERAARQCLGLDPHNLPGLLDLGRIQLERSDLSAAAATAAKARVCSPISATPLLLEAEVILARNAKLPGGLRETQLAAAEADLKATEALAAWSPLRDVLRAQALLLRPGSGAGGRQRAVQAASMLRQAFLQDRLLPLKYRPWLDRAVKASA